jgi:hypothetical protein
MLAHWNNSISVLLSREIYIVCLSKWFITYKMYVSDCTCKKFWTRQIKLLQYSQRHSMINHCDKRITHLSDTGIYLLVCLIYILILICLFGDSKQHSKCKRIFNDVFNRAKDISKSPRWESKIWNLRQVLTENGESRTKPTPLIGFL